MGKIKEKDREKKHSIRRRTGQTERRRRECVNYDQINEGTIWVFIEGWKYTSYAICAFQFFER